MIWFLRAQRITALASFESEYVAHAGIVNETKFLRHVQELIMPTLRSCAISIMEDNQGAIKRANNKHSSRRGWVRIIYVGREEQHVDILTNALGMRTSSCKQKLQ